jgi:hypothetical protein
MNQANKQVSHNTKIKSGREIRQSKAPSSLSKTSLHSTKMNNGKKKKRWKPLSSKNNSILYLAGNEENGYPILDPNKTMINVTKEPSDAHKKP